MNNLERIEMRYIVPVAAMISAGKSHLLNALYNIDLLESKSGIVTKFVNILRYNPKIKEPRFFHLIVIKVGERYIFYKDNSEKEIIGKQNIIEAIKKINEKLAKENYVDYENIFYMTEINESPFITNKEYLLKHDLCDIPGLSEYQENGDNESNEIKEYDDMNKSELKTEDDIYYNIKLEKNSYINEIFSIIKDYIDGGIIILSVENYYYKQNYEMIATLKKVIKKEINNFLIILNKIDLSENPEEDAKKCKGLISQNFPSFKTFNISKNTFIPLSVNQLKNELLLRNDFKYLLNFHFQNYFNKIKKEEKNAISAGKSFIDHLRGIIKNAIQISKEEIKKKIDESKKIKDDEIINIINDIKNNFAGDDLKFGIDEGDFDDDDDYDDDEICNNENISHFIDKINPSYIVKLVYIFHKEKKLIPPLSKESQALLNYFNQTKDINNIIPFKEQKAIDLHKYNEAKNLQTLINKEIMDELMKVTKEIENSKFSGPEIKNIMNELYLTIYYLKIYNVIFIPFIGPSNGGKSTIINNIIGEEVLECGAKECTKKGIIIRYKDDNEDDITIRKANFIEEEFSGLKNYYFAPKKDIITSGLKNVQDIIQGINYDFPDKEENSFYYIKTKIKLFDDLGFDDNLKKMIYLIDFPGFGTGNIFERILYKKVMSICNTFIFVVRNSIIKEKSKKDILDKLFIQSMRNKEKLPSGFIKSCLFVFNNDREQTTTKNDLDMAKRDIRSIIKRIPQEDINACFFNAKFYKKYQFNFNFFNNITGTIFYLFNSYLSLNQKMYIDPEKYNGIQYANFGEYLYKTLDDKIRDLKLTNAKIKKIEPNKNVEKKVNEIIKILEDKQCIRPNEVTVKKKLSISQIFTYARENINEMQEFKESNIEQFKKAFIDQIIYINKEMQEDLFDKINKVIIALDYFFNSDFSERKKYLELFKEFQMDIKKTKNKLKNLSKSGIDLIEKEKGNYIYNIKKLIDERKNKIKIELEIKDWKLYQEEVIQEIKSITEKFTKKIKNFITAIDIKSNELYNNAKNLCESITEGKMEFKDYKKFESFFPEHVSKKGANITNEIINVVKICTENGFSKIWEKKGIIDLLKSLFFRVQYLTNIFEIINNDLNNQIEYIIDLLNKNLTKYIDSIINFIDSNYKIISTKYTAYQKNEWDNLCKMYDDSRNKIQTNLEKLKQIKNS